MALKIIISASVLALVLVLVYLLVRYRRVRRQLQEEARVRRLVEGANYRLACALYGQQVVDRVMRDANGKGVN